MMSLPVKEEVVEIGTVKIEPGIYAEQESDMITETIHVDKEEEWFKDRVEGRQIDRLMRVSKAVMSVSADGIAEIKGSRREVERALKYLRFLSEQRLGTIKIKNVEDNDGDLLSFVLPTEAKIDLNHLKVFLEEEFNTLIYHNLTDDQVQHIWVCGGPRERAGCLFRLVSEADTMYPGTASKMDIPMMLSREECLTKILTIENALVSWYVVNPSEGRRKISKAANCVVDFISGSFYLFGHPDEIRRATDYINWASLLSSADPQRHPVIDPSNRLDLTTIDLHAQKQVKRISGPGRSTLSSLEQEFGVVCIFINRVLGIFGETKGRRGAELKAKSILEHQTPGLYTVKFEQTISSRQEWDTDLIQFSPEDLGYAVGPKGSTMRALTRASNSIIQAIGRWVLFSGLLEDRRRARRYMKWLLDQRRHCTNPQEMDPETDDATIIKVPYSSDLINLRASKGELMRGVEDETGTLLFASQPHAAVIICCHDPIARSRAACKLLSKLEDNKRARLRVLRSRDFERDWDTRDREEYRIEDRYDPPPREFRDRVERAPRRILGPGPTPPREGSDRDPSRGRDFRSNGRDTRRYR